MASLIEGYNYDIFISYRQKDNKYDGWVTEFVENLKKELEATFKEDISVYFDINPHDGLLETHDVDASLKEKLKCLVFLPIISRTYCDPKSFAWEHEFKAFIEQASKDQLGLKVKLPNGNVASRVLPIRIYDLDTTDIKLCESVLRGVLRCVDFIYKSAGVNRPLRANEDHPLDNINKTYYRDQINKVANSIKEIVTSMGQHEQKHEVIQKEQHEPVSIQQKSNKTKIIAGSLILLALFVIGFFIVSHLIKPKEKLEKWIAVLPFNNDSPSDTNNPIINGINRDISSNLQSIKDLNVVSQYSAEKYKDPSRYNIREIAKDLNVNYLVTGSIQKYGTNLILRVELIDAINDKTLWSKSYPQDIHETKDIFYIQSQIAKAIAAELKVVITPEEKQLIDKAPTASLTAYDFYQRGREEHIKYWIANKDRETLQKAEDLYHQALQYDSTYALSYTGLARVYWDKHYFQDYLSKNFMDSVLTLCDIALSYDNQLAEAYTLKGGCYSETGKPKQAVEEFDKAIKFNPNDWMAYRWKGRFFYETDWANYIYYLQKAASINRGEELPELLSLMGYAYYSAGFPEKAIQYYKDKLKLDGDSANYYAELSRYENWQEDYNKSIEFGIKGYAIDSTNKTTLVILGSSYAEFGQYDESLKYYNKWIKRSEDQGDEWFLGSSHRIGYIYSQKGNREMAEYYFNKQINYCDRSIELGRLYAQMLYAYYDLAGVYAFRKERDKAYENLQIFNKKPMMSFWMVSLIKTDPLFSSIRNESEFQQIVRDVEVKYQAEHERVRKLLEEQKVF
jgi:TolB-like protein/Tfp pilus assembly protein PilF